MQRLRNLMTRLRECIFRGVRRTLGMFTVSPETKNTLLSNVTIAEKERGKEPISEWRAVHKLSCLSLLHE